MPPSNKCRPQIDAAPRSSVNKINATAFNRAHTIVYSAPSKETAKCNFVCLLHFPEYSAVSTQGAYHNDHQPSLNRIIVLKVKEIASPETEERIHTDDLEHTLGYAFLQAY